MRFLSSVCAYQHMDAGGRDKGGKLNIAPLPDFVYPLAEGNALHFLALYILSPSVIFIVI